MILKKDYIWWALNDYLTQWKEAIRRLDNHNESCFVVTIHNPNIRKYIDWWVIYKINNKLHIQNNIIIDDLYDEIIGDKTFTSESCYDFIPQYRLHTQEGNKLSEWIVEWDGKV